MAQMAAEVVEIEVRSIFNDQTSTGMNTARHNVDRFSQSIDRTQREMDRLSGTTASPSVTLRDRASATLSKITNGVRTFTSKAWQATVGIVDKVTGPLRAIKNSLFSVKGLVMAIGAGMAANKLLMEPIGLADAYSSAKIGFSTLLGDAGGQQMMNDLDDFAKKTPFKTSGVIENAQKMMAMGWDVNTLLKDMETIGDAAAATGKMDQGLESIVRALAQIKTKGKLSTEELNQLSEAGIAAKAMLAEQLGYGTGDKGIAAMTEDLEDGLIGSETAIQALLAGMEQFDGTMERTANETVEGLKSQLEDTFEINILRKWGQGLQDGAKRGLGSVLALLDKSESSLARFGDTVYEIGKELSNWAADKLENTIDKILRITNSKEFKEASIGGKIKILWDEVIAKPFSNWWESTGKPFMIDKFNGLGEGLGSGISNVLKGLFGVVDADAMGEATTIGGSFAKGFTTGFDGKGVAKAIWNAFKEGMKSAFDGNWLGMLLMGNLALKVSSGILGLQNLWLGTGAGASFGQAGLGYAGGGLKGFLGGASTASGALVGTGLIGSMAKFGSFLGSGAYGGAGLSAVGGGAALGGILGGVGLVKGGYNLYQGATSDNSQDKKFYETRGLTKIGAVGAGAAAGAAIGSFIPVVGTAAGALIGAGIGGIGALWKGNDIADKISGISKSTKELKEEAQQLKNVNMAKHFGDVELSAEQVDRKVSDILGADTIARAEKFKSSMQDISTIQKKIATYKDDIAFTGARIAAGEKVSEEDINAYSTAITGYTDSIKSLLSTNKSNGKAAFQYLYGDDTKGMQEMMKDINSNYNTMEKQLKKRTDKLNKVMEGALKDGKITPIEEEEIKQALKQIEKIENQIKQKKEEAEKNASWDLLKLKYTDTDLSPDSYKKMISEFNNQIAEEATAADEAYITAKAELNLAYDDKTSEKYLNKLKEIEEKWINAKSEPIKKSVEFSVEILKDNYDTQFTKLKRELSSGDTLSDGAGGILSKTYSKKNNPNGRGFVVDKESAVWNVKEATVAVNDAHREFLNAIGATDEIQVQMAEFYETLKPQEEQLNSLKDSYTELGKDVPQWINDALADIENIKLMSGDKTVFEKMIGKQLALEDPEHAKKLIKDANLPKAIKEGIEEAFADHGKSEPIEVATNLKFSAIEEDNIDTSGLDSATEKVVQSMQKEGVIIVKDGEVKIRTKDGKIDTTGLDEKLAAEIRRLEEEGVIKITKDGQVTINPQIVNKEEAKGKTDTETKNVLGKPAIVDKNADVTVNSTTNTEPAVKATNGEIKTAFANPFTTGATVNVNSSTGTISGLSTVKESFIQKIKNKLGNLSIGTTISPRLTSMGYGGPQPLQNANGSRVDSPILTWVGENNNREYIIPVSSGKRQRGLDLWMQAGKDLGVMNNADGGVYGGSGSGASLGRLMTEANSNHSGNNTDTSHNSNRNQKVEVNVGGVTIEIKSSGENVAADIASQKDSICSEIADMLQVAFQNLPLATQ